MIEVGDIFYVRYGVNLELNRMTIDPNGINFVSRTAKNNGVSAKVKCLSDVEPIEAGVLSVAGGGSVLETFLQPYPFYSGRDLYYLKAKVEMSYLQKLYYCACIRANKYRYNYGRQANRTLKQILIPSLEKIPAWVNKANPDMYENADLPSCQQSGIDTIPLNISEWKEFPFSELFEIERGRGPRRHQLDGKGKIPFISSTDSNNGLTGFTTMTPMHQANTVGVNRNGSVGEAFYQPEPFCSTEDVHIFTSKFIMNPFVGLFIATLIRQEKYRYNYGRKWGIERMKNSKIRLPVSSDGSLDLDFMERYIRALPFSSQIDNDMARAI